WLEDQQIHQAEHRRVQADAQRERDQRDAGEAGRFEQLPEGEADVVHGSRGAGIFGEAGNYSERSAVTGSTRVARRAGNRQASMAAAPSPIETSANVGTSSGATLKSSLRIANAVAAAANRPTPSPTTIGRPPC